MMRAIGLSCRLVALSSLSPSQGWSAVIGLLIGAVLPLVLLIKIASRSSYVNVTFPLCPVLLVLGISFATAFARMMVAARCASRKLHPAEALRYEKRSRRAPGEVRSL